MADYPDGTYPVDIVRQDLASLKVDLVAQTIAEVAIDIVAQSLATLGVNIKAQDLASLAVDIAAQTLATLGVNIKAQDLASLAVDIAAQTLGNLGVNIKAQDLASLAVDIAAQTLASLNIDITAQSVGNLTMSVVAQTIGVQIYREWASTTNKQKTASGLRGIGGNGSAAVVTYEVPGGSVLYISGFSGGGTQVGHVSLIVSGLPTLSAYFLASQSVPRTLGIPQKVTAGTTVYVSVYNDSANIGTFTADFEGWEEAA